MKEFGRAIMDSIRTVDNQHKSISYEGLAQRALEIKDPWLSLHSQILADATVFRLVSQKHRGAEANDADDIHYSIGWAFDIMEESEEYHVYKIVEEIRNALCRRAAAISDILMSEFSTLEGFDGLTINRSSPVNSLGFIRYSNIEPYEFIKTKQDEATRAYVNVIQLSAESPSKASAYIYQADLAVFESWLVAQSIAMKDETYVLAAIRWALATASLETLEGLPNKPKLAASEIRKSLLWAVGPENAKSLRKYLMKF
jgi:hypothetical protein